MEQIRNAILKSLRYNSSYLGPWEIHIISFLTLKFIFKNEVIISNLSVRSK